MKLHIVLNELSIKFLRPKSWRTITLKSETVLKWNGDIGKKLDFDRAAVCRPLISTMVYQVIRKINILYVETYGTDQSQIYNKWYEPTLAFIY